jgi:hypothetical protein
MREDLRRRLRELGVVRGIRNLSTLTSDHPSHAGANFVHPEAEVAPFHAAIEDLVPGHFHTTFHGQCFVTETTYPLDHLHGNLPLSSYLNLHPETIAQVGQEDQLSDVDVRRICFLDTETTGLSGGTGTMAFVVGLCFFADESVHVRQYFLRDPGDEPAMIEALAEFLPGFEALASFNGRAFDVPILENRFILARISPPTAELPHLDLLHPARRLWQYHLASCSLGTIEQEILGVLREQDDVPGGLIPYLYRDYLRTGDAREMKRVLYHNAVDVLSLITLTIQLCRTFSNPWIDLEDERGTGLSGAELLGIGRWYTALGRVAEAERAYRAVLRTCPPGQAVKSSVPPDPKTPNLRTKVLRDIGYLLKRDGRRDEALAYWQQLALEAETDILAYVEIAKYFEWYVEDLALAAGWTQAALTQAEKWPIGTHRHATLAELRHRLARLERKIDRSHVSDSEGESDDDPTDRNHP